jgi:heat-inducible transcriptional repressor
MHEEISERKKRILKAIVEAYIAYGEPVGSKYLALREQLSCSSATIRNEMAELEALGYLEQPHTSAGRIPSEAGYSFYVNTLLERYNMTQREISQIHDNLSHKLAELDQILAEASRIASSFTNYPSIAATPRDFGVAIDRFEIMHIDSRTFALTMRLFANMLGGHVVLYAMVSLTAIFGAMAAPSLAVAICLYLFEVFVAFLQAYVFTMLSAIFIGMMVHPQH